MVARKLHRMIMEHPTLLRSSHKGLGGGGSGGGGANAPGSRPLLVVLDRNADLITPVQHTSTYQALIDDVLHHAANRVEFEVTDDTATKGGKPNPKKIAKRYDLDPDQDPFYAAQKFQPFPEAIESNGTELQEVTQREQEVRSKRPGATTTPVRRRWIRLRREPEIWRLQSIRCRPYSTGRSNSKCTPASCKRS